MPAFCIGYNDAPSGRATCEICQKRVQKTDEALIVVHYYSGDRKQFHVDCIAKIIALKLREGGKG